MSPASKQHNVSGIAKAAALLMVVSLGIWGCARHTGGQTNNTDRVRALEARCVKLEQDYRSVAQARDQAKKSLATIEDEVSRLQKELGDHLALLRERDQLRKQLKASQSESEQLRQTLAERTNERDALHQQTAQRTIERDALQGRCDRFRKGIQELLMQDDAPNGVLPGINQPSPSAGPSLGGQS